MSERNENYQAALASTAWPFIEARKICERLRIERDLLKGVSVEGSPRKVIFQTGYGPSGLPHIGTFGEVLRTSMVRRAFSLLSSEYSSELLCFSDDMDGFRKVPANAEHADLLRAHLGKPLSRVPDLHGCHASYASHNNEKLKSFLDRFGFSYRFVSSTECYSSGLFDAGLRRMLECYDSVLELMCGSLGKERRQTYSPFLPICEESGVVLQARVLEVDARRGTLVYERTDGKRCETSVYGGKCKLQWKPDWAMRWYVLGVDYEMYGKDLIPSAQLSQQIVRILCEGDEGARGAPAGFAYELFLDESGEKISKSRGNGLSLEDWLDYASEDSLAYYMYKKPRTAKRLFFDCIPRCLDEYLQECARYERLTDIGERFSSPIFHIEQRQLSSISAGLSFSLLQNLVTAMGLQSVMGASATPAATNAENNTEVEGAWRTILQAELPPDITKAEELTLQRLWNYALAYDRDFVRPSCRPRAANADEYAALRSLALRLGELASDSAVETIQQVVYEVGLANGYEGRLGDWFRALYEILLGQSTGPRFGSFLKLYGLEKGIALLEGVRLEGVRLADADGDADGDGVGSGA